MSDFQDPPQSPINGPASEESKGGNFGPFDPEGVIWSRVSPALARVRRMIAAVFLIPVIIGLIIAAALTGFVWLYLAATVSVLFLAWLIWLIGRQVRAMGYAERAEDLLIRRGIMFQSMVVVPYGRMQYVDVSVGPVARYYKISSVQLHTASPGTDAAIVGLPPEEAARLRDRLAARGESRLAGL